MFLFTTQGAPQAARGGEGDPVRQAIRAGADRSGVAFDYLVRTAERESALDPQARARTSSATGLFQFIEQTWLEMVRSEGPRLGLQEAADAIRPDPDGRLSVADAGRRAEILHLRTDPEMSATMAGALTRRNRDTLQMALGRAPNAGELYAAHVLGARGARELIESAASDPDRLAARSFPEAAEANRGIFYDRAGRGRTVSEVLAALTTSHAGLAFAASEPAATGGTTGAAGRAGLLGLFSNASGGTAGRGPVSDAVARIWSARHSATPGRVQTAALDSRDGNLRDLAAAEPAPRYFPSRDGAALAAPATETPAAAQPALAPLPPSRPADLAASAARAARRAAPLDLNAFLPRTPRP